MVFTQANLSRRRKYSLFARSICTPLLRSICDGMVQLVRAPALQAGDVGSSPSAVTKTT
jgi:hypothetical protein